MARRCGGEGEIVDAPTAMEEDPTKRRLAFDVADRAIRPWLIFTALGALVEPEVKINMNSVVGSTTVSGGEASRWTTN